MPLMLTLTLRALMLSVFAAASYWITVKAGVKEQINVLKQVNLFGTYVARVNGRM
jgi:hypothetical protein